MSKVATDTNILDLRTKYITKLGWFFWFWPIQRYDTTMGKWQILYLRTRYRSKLGWIFGSARYTWRYIATSGIPHIMTACLKFTCSNLFCLGLDQPCTPFTATLINHAVCPSRPKGRSLSDNRTRTLALPAAAHDATRSGRPALRAVHAGAFHIGVFGTSELIHRIGGQTFSKIGLGIFNLAS